MFLLRWPCLCPYLSCYTIPIPFQILFHITTVFIVLPSLPFPSLPFPSLPFPSPSPTPSPPLPLPLPLPLPFFPACGSCSSLAPSVSFPPLLLLPLFLLLPVLSPSCYQDVGFLLYRSGIRSNIVSSTISPAAHLPGVQSSLLSYPIIFPSSCHLVSSE